MGIASIVNKRKLAALITVVIIFSQSIFMQLSNNLITVQDGVRGASGYFLDDIGQWLKQNAGSGLILVAASSHDALIFVSGFPLNRFITEGMQKYWSTSLKDPTKYAEYVIMHQGDLVYDKLHNNPLFLKNYKLVFKGQFSSVYKKV